MLANCGWPHCVSHTASHYLYSVLLQKMIGNGAASTFTCGIPPIDATNSTQGFLFRKRNSKSRSQQLHIVMWKNERKKVQGPGTNARPHIPKWICPLTSLECIPGQLNSDQAKAPSMMGFKLVATSDAQLAKVWPRKLERPRRQQGSHHPCSKRFTPTSDDNFQVFPAKGS